ncbi:MAG: hypothetical protein ACXIUP_06940 [Microcella sp.]
MDSRPPLRDIFRGPRGRLLAALLVTEFAAGVSGISYAAVLPVASIELDGLAQYGIAVAVTGVVGIAMMPVGAYLYARIGPQAQLWIATAVFLGGVALTVTAPSMTVLITGLAVRGLATGLLAGLGIGVLSTVYTEAAERERAFGLFALMWVIPSLVGPAVTSLVLLLADWRVALAWPAMVLLLGRVLVSRSLRALDIERTEAPASVRGAGWFAGVAVGLAAALVLIGFDALPSVGAAVVITGLVVVLAFPQALASVVAENRRVRSGAVAFAIVCARCFGINAVLPLVSAVFVDPSGVLGAVLVAVAPLGWALVSAGGAGARLSTRDAYRLSAIVFPIAALAMGLVYPKVLADAFTDFREQPGESRAHGGVAMELGEGVGTAAGSSVVAGVGGVIVASAGGGEVALFMVAVGAVITVLFGAARRNPTWSG